jgi:amylosucrase
MTREPFPAAPIGDGAVGTGPSPSSMPPVSADTADRHPDRDRLEAARAVAAEVLAGAAAHQRELFDIRLTKWWPDLWEGVAELYPAAEAEALGRRLVELAARAYAAREPELQRLDLERTLSPDWFQSQSMLGYAAYAERFAGDLAGVASKVDYLHELGVTYLHLMPLLTPREGDSDGGYAVADYRSVRSDLGTTEDLRKLATALRHAGISLVLDLVLNHVAREHEWAVKARQGDPRYRRYFYVFDDREQVDAFEATLPEVFPDFAPGNFTWDEDLQGWVWTTFNSFQWDVNWSNPDVLCEYADIVLFLAGLGVEVLRLDAVAFMWKRLDTNSQNQPEVHAIARTLRALARIACPALVFKAEAIVAPSDLVQYLGQGRHYGKVSDIAYHNSLMVQIWSMLAAGDVRLAVEALRGLPPVPPTTSWVTYVRCHDDIGWAIDDTDAWRSGLNGWDHRTFLSDYFSGIYPGTPARGLVFQSNPATGDRRISGTTASLAGLEAALEAGDGAAVDTAIARIALSHAIIMGWGGIPVIWSGDELAQLNDPAWHTEPGHEADNRWAHRPRLDWELAERRHEPFSIQQRVFDGLAHLHRVRAGLPQFHASVPARITEVFDDAVLPVLREHPLGPLLGLYNVRNDWRPYPRAMLTALGLDDGVDRVSGDRLSYGDDGNLWLPPYGFRWITAA